MLGTRQAKVRSVIALRDWTDMLAADNKSMWSGKKKDDNRHQFKKDGRYVVRGRGHEVRLSYNYSKSAFRDYEVKISKPYNRALGREWTHLSTTTNFGLILFRRGHQTWYQGAQHGGVTGGRYPLRVYYPGRGGWVTSI